MIKEIFSLPFYLCGMPPGNWKFYNWDGRFVAVCQNRSLIPINISYHPEGGLMWDMTKKEYAQWKKAAAGL